MSVSESNDAIRDIILRSLYERHKNARGMRSITIGIMDLQSDLKKLGIKKQSVNSNLDYLVQKGWVCVDIKRTQFTTKSGLQKTNEKFTYKISALGIDKLEGASLYSENHRDSLINITNINGVTVLGDGNIVNTEMVELSRLFAELKNLVLTTTEMDSVNKLSVSSDIDSIRSQLSKPKPIIGIIKSLWAGIESAVTLVEFGEIISKITNYLSSFPS